ncbi:DUF885 domain-containing protein [Bowmanella pacifica]|uniref:DUF885 domain-containing protein n=1 Tax=Bowmanella pacifica TaxID=502051 RepID=A0A917YZS0_9ALTE|nr:DUF885 domain-containing protein [Bowmanella pacifica]GGO71219.1 hypothetical protein GCM10010982_26510 [Bowmanella pacifica]
MKTTRLAISLLALAFSQSLVADTVTESFKQLLDKHWQAANKEQIFFRKDPDTFRMNGKLPDMSEQGRKRRAEFNQNMLRQLDKINWQQLSAADQLTYRLFKYERQSEAESYQQLDHLYPFTIYAGYHTYFAAAPDNMSFLDRQDYENYLISLADFPRYNQDYLTNLQEAVSKGHTQYCQSFAGYEQTISKHLVKDVEESVFFAPFKNMPARIPVEQQQALTHKGKQLIAQSVLPEYKKLFDFFTGQYMPNCRQEVGISALPGGKDYYQYLIQFYTTTNMPAEQIHQLGLSEVQRIRSEMQAIIDKLGFKGSFKEFIQHLRTDPKFYATSELQLLEKAAYITRKMAGQLPKWFITLPRNTFDIKASPGGGAYYVASDGSGTTSGTYFLGTKNLKAEPLYNLEALTFHEAEPGHHFQSAIAGEMDMPEFRKTLYHSAYGEGWGLYSERLGKEMGFYQDPYSDFGRLTYEAWRASRLVVDTGMHALGWSRQQAIDYLADNTALSMPDVVNQIDRYVSWPAQALSYKIGELKILELRQRAQQQLGDKFDIRAFHEQILRTGSLPLDLLEELTNEWIAEQG